MTTSPSDDTAPGGRPPASEGLNAAAGDACGAPAADNSIDLSFLDKDGVNADSIRDVNPWHPITSAVDLKHLGKLAEECNELGAAVARCIIQGVDEAHPVTGKVNRHWLEDEIADVLANIDLVVDRFNLDIFRMRQRRNRKKDHLKQWHEMA